jgi:hypothetical protein
MTRPDWLPPLVEMGSRDWDNYLALVYSYFRTDFVESSPDFQGTRLGLKRYPVIDGKEATFWHLISEGKAEADRLPDIRRCEHIRWPRPIIENYDDSRLRVWENDRGGEARVCLWLVEEDYLVVLAKRKGYVLLWTAYLVTRKHTKEKLLKEFESRRKG